MNADPVLSLALASEIFNHMIQFDAFRFLSGKKGVVPFLKKKTTENSIQMVSVQGLSDNRLHQQLFLGLPKWTYDGFRVYMLKIFETKKAFCVVVCFIVI